jgi:shikimate dehydrogenase
MTQQNVPLAGVIGDPIAHSKSPRLHGYWLGRYGIVGQYVPLHARAENLAQVLRAMPRMGFVGANVTIPHKEAALALADTVSDQARRIGAANTLTFTENGGFHADNTDGIGFLANLRQNAPHWQADQGAVMMIGAGGAARAIVVALLDAGAPEIILTNRTLARAKALAVEFGPRLRVVDWADTENHLAFAQTVVNTTALGMDGKDAFPFSLYNVQQGAVVTDIVYTPLETPFLRAAKAQGCHVVDGLGMLLHQAAPGFARWFGHMPEVDAQTRQVVLGA